MPAASVDTFFACSLMVLLVLSSMVTASKIFSPYLNGMAENNAEETYRQISKYLLLNKGDHPEWGVDGEFLPESFGLARAGSDIAYELDIDKVTRLNSQNVYAVGYSDAFTLLRMPDISFRIEVKPVFRTNISLVATFTSTDSDIYQFHVFTEKDGAPFQSELKCYLITSEGLNSTSATAKDGYADFNVTISNETQGPGLLVVMARSTYSSELASFGTFAFAHALAEPKPDGTYVNLSPLNYALRATFVAGGVVLSNAYALAFRYNSTLRLTENNSEFVKYAIPHFLDSGPTVVVVTGWNSTIFFTENTAYPHIPFQFGVDFSHLQSLSNVFAYTYLVKINFALYQCLVWVGGPKQ